MKIKRPGKQYFFTFAITLLFSACGNHDFKNVDLTLSSDTIVQEIVPDTADFDLRKLPVSKVDIGEFPYLKPPANYCFDYCQFWKGKIKKDDIKELDREFFAYNGKLVPINGKSYKQIIVKNTGADHAKFNAQVVAKAFDIAILNLGGVQVNGVAVPYSEIERLDKQQVLDYGHAIDIKALDQIHTYIIRKEDREIWIQLSLLDNNIGKITVMENTNDLGY